MLELSKFKAVVKNTPLVSIDLCLIFKDQILLGKRKNDPLKGEWFTPGGRIYKNETWQNTLLRISKVELGLRDILVEDFSLMGVWDHFYKNSAFSQDISTHYVNLPHCAYFKFKPKVISDDQHADLRWFDLSAVAGDEKLHLHMRDYARWLLNKIGNTYD